LVNFLRLKAYYIYCRPRLIQSVFERVEGRAPICARGALRYVFRTQRGYLPAGHVSRVSWQRGPDIGWICRTEGWSASTTVHGKLPRRVPHLASTCANPRWWSRTNRSFRLWRALPLDRLAGDAARGRRRCPVDFRESPSRDNAVPRRSFSALLTLFLSRRDHGDRSQRGVRFHGRVCSGSFDARYVLDDLLQTEVNHSRVLICVSYAPISVLFSPALFASLSRARLTHRDYAFRRARWPVKVNCWFCNENTKISRKHLNWWLCPWCVQYNGFSKVNYSLPAFILFLLSYGVHARLSICWKTLFLNVLQNACFRMAITRTIFQSSTQHRKYVRDIADCPRTATAAMSSGIISVRAATSGKVWNCRNCPTLSPRARSFLIPNWRHLRSIWKRDIHYATAANPQCETCCAGRRCG